MAKPKSAKRKKMEADFKRIMPTLSSRDQFLVLGVIKDMLILRNVPDDYVGHLINERLQIK